jgi:hypothetical protein
MSFKLPPASKAKVVKIYPLHIRQVGEAEACYVTHGHHSPEAFRAEMDRLGYSPVGEPIHRWARIIPSRNPEFDCFYRIYAEPAPGLFPVTVEEPPI